MTPRVTASTPREQWPVALTSEEVAILLGYSVRAWANRVSARRAFPPPIVTEDGQYQKPIRWNRDTVAGYLAGALPDKRRRYFRTAKARRAA